MPRSKDSLCVFSELKNLSDEADRLAESLPKVSDLDPFFDAIKETVLKIKDCTTVKQLKEIPFPPDLNHYLKKEDEEKIKIIHTPEAQKEHVHAEKIGSSVCKSFNKDRDLEICIPAYGEKSISVASLTNLNKQTPKFIETSNNVETAKLFKTPCTTQQTIEIPAPALNRTFSKDNNQTPVNKILLRLTDETLRITRSASKNKAEGSNSKVASWLHENSFSLKQRLQDENKNSRSMVQSGSKRKSSSTENEKNKKPKVEVKSKSKTSQRKQNLKTNVLRPANGLTQNTKVPAIIVPTLKHSIASDVNLKEKKLEELQKKEVKANENRKKVLANRQLKAEEQKKKREERMEKALQKRLLLDKEKDPERSTDAKMSQVEVLVKSVEKPILKPKSKELQEQKAPEAGPSQKEMTVDSTTPAINSPHDSETYDLTPAPDSSTYDFSDEEENESKGKLIPSWASGVLLKSALIHQFYNPPNTDAIFGAFVEPTDLGELFGVKKNYYYKRTSSAIWHTHPN